MINELIENHLGYAHAIAAEFAGKYPPSITRADLKGAAEFGLVQAAHSYDPSRNASFATFAYYRIRGAIFDEVRKSWQASHLKSGGDVSASEELAARGQQASTSWSDLGDSVSFQESCFLISLESTNVQQVSTATESPASWILREEESEIIREAIERLPKRHRFVLRAYYYEEHSLASIGVQLNLSKSWVSRIHAQALTMIREVLQETRRGPVSRRRPYAQKRAIPLQATF